MSGERGHEVGHLAEDDRLCNGIEAMRHLGELVWPVTLPGEHG